MFGNLDRELFGCGFQLLAVNDGRPREKKGDRNQPPEEQFGHALSRSLA
jgi:hypothetical protein